MIIGTRRKHKIIEFDRSMTSRAQFIVVNNLIVLLRLDFEREVARLIDEFDRRTWQERSDDYPKSKGQVVL